MFGKGSKEITDEEIEQELKENCCKVRKIEVLEKLPLQEWTKEELAEAIVSYNLTKCTGNLPICINTIEQYIRKGKYRECEMEWEEYKISEAKEEMIEELISTERKIIRHKTVLEELELKDWNRHEMIKFIEEHKKNSNSLW